MSSFTQLRSQVRSLESQTTELLSRFSSFVSSTSSSATQEEAQLASQIQSLIDQRSDIIASLTRIADSDATTPATKLQQLQRHREVLAEHSMDFQRMKASIAEERTRLNLLFSVRSDIDAHRSRGVPRETSEADYMASERGAIDGAHGVADRLLAQAFETREEFSRQRAILSNAQRRMWNTLNQIPGINTVISKVNTRKKRDSLILAGLITMCVLFLLFVR